MALQAVIVNVGWAWLHYPLYWVAVVQGLAGIGWGWFASWWDIDRHKPSDHERVSS